MSLELVIDADGHCQEPREGLAAWMPSEYAGRGATTALDEPGSSRMLIDGRSWAQNGGMGSTVHGPFAPHIVGSHPGMEDPRQRLKDMDEEGIDVAVIFGTPIALTVNGLPDTGLAGALCHAVNRWLVEEYPTCT